MQNTIIQAGGIAVVATVSFLTGIGGADLADKVLAPPKPVGLHLVSLEWNANEYRVVQNIQPINTPALKAEWAAKFIRNGEVICAGGGKSNYDGTIHRFTPNDWTGDDCPPLLPGDIGSASWTYRDVSGQFVTIAGRIEIK